MAEKRNEVEFCPLLFDRERENIPKLAVAYHGRLLADSSKSHELDDILDRGGLMEEDESGRIVPARPAIPEYSTPQVLAGEELAARFVDKLFEDWGIESTKMPDPASIELPQCEGIRTDEFGHREGAILDNGLYYDILNMCDANMADSDAEIFTADILHEAIGIADKALEEFENGKLRPGSWALSCGAMAMKARAHLEVGSQLVALHLMYHLGEFMTMHKLHDHELALKKRKADSGKGGGNSRALTDEEEKAAAQKFRELYATSQISKTGAQERIGKEFGVSRQTIGRIVAKYPSEK